MSAPAAAKPPSDYAGRTVGEIISGWNDALETQTTRFKEFAKQVGDWDKHILAASARQLELSTELRYVQSAQTRAQHELEILEVHQREVHQSLLSMEKSVASMFDARGEQAGGCAGGAGGNTDPHGAASTRKAMYAAAEEISRQLVAMGQQLRETIESLNDSRSREADASNPISAVVAILNNQLSSLVWLDKQATAIEAKLRSYDAGGADGVGGAGAPGTAPHAHAPPPASPAGALYAAGGYMPR